MFSTIIKNPNRIFWDIWENDFKVYLNEYKVKNKKEYLEKGYIKAFLRYY